MEQQSKPKLLLHICCAPCSAGVVPDLLDKYEVIGFFYNPNIDDPEEYEKRKCEMEKFSSVLSIPVIFGKYNIEIWRKATQGFENEPEGGKRCEICFRLRLQETSKMAEEQGIGQFCTTLTVAPMKNARLINRVGEEVGQYSKSNYLPSDFKKKDGYKKSIALSKEFGLYRQNFCGCSHSRKIRS